jgi:hypothetical protein
MSALINYDGGENDLRTTYRLVFYPAWSFVCVVSYATQSEEQRLPAAYIKVSILQYHHQCHHPQNALGYIANPSLSQRSEPSTIFHTSPCMFPARLLKSFDSDNQFSRRKSLSVHIGRTLQATRAQFVFGGRSTTDYWIPSQTCKLQSEIFHCSHVERQSSRTTLLNYIWDLSY